MKTFLMRSFLYIEINNKFILAMNILTNNFSLKCFDFHLRCLLYVIIFPVKAYMHVVSFSTCLNMFDSGIEITRFCEIWLCTFICLMKYNTCILIFSMIKFLLLLLNSTKTIDEKEWKIYSYQLPIES